MATDTRDGTQIRCRLRVHPGASWGFFPRGFTRKSICRGVVHETPGSDIPCPVVFFVSLVFMEVEHADYAEDAT